MIFTLPQVAVSFDAYGEEMGKKGIPHAIVQKRHRYDECRSLADMVDRSSAKQPAIVIADRGYESYNVLAHIQEKGWFFLIRVKDVGQHGGFVTGFDLPSGDELDRYISLSLTKKERTK